MRRNPQYKYLINTSPSHLEVHDLDNEKTGPLECQITEIIQAGNAQYINAQSEQDLIVWFRQNPAYDGCNYCLPQYHRK